MRRREFLSRSLAVSAMAGLYGARTFADEPIGWAQVPGILARIVPPVFPDRDFYITDYGAVGEGFTDCQPAVKAAIEACSAAGGGRVVAPPGVFLLNGPIHLLSNVNLYLEAGCTLYFGANPSDYLPLVEVRWQGIRCYNYSPLIYARSQTNIAITGAGLIDGQASGGWNAWLTLQNPDYTALQKMAVDKVPVEKRIFGPGHYLRPTLFEPYECSNILLQGVSLIGSPFWTIHPTFCTNVTVQNVNVSPGITNDDGCDPDSCSDVLVDGCNFSTNDDNISVKAGSGADAVGLPPCTNVIFRNCHLLGTEFGAFTMGSGTTGGIENIFFENCYTAYCLFAFLIKSNDELGGSVQNVWVRSCGAGFCHHLLYIETDYGGIVGGPTPPLFKNLNLEEITCAIAFVSAFFFLGDARRPIRDVNLTDIAIGQSPVLEQITNAIDLNSTGVTLAGQPVTVTP